MLTDASLLIGLGRLDEADRVLSEMLDQATPRVTSSWRARRSRALARLPRERGQEAQALQLFEQAIERGGRPDPAEREALYTHTARLRSFSGDAGGAVALIEECLGRVSSEPDADLGRDRALLDHAQLRLRRRRPVRPRQLGAGRGAANRRRGSGSARAAAALLRADAPEHEYRPLRTGHRVLREEPRNRHCLGQRPRVLCLPAVRPRPARRKRHRACRPVSGGGASAGAGSAGLRRRRLPAGRGGAVLAAAG